MKNLKSLSDFQGTAISLKEMCKMVGGGTTQYSHTTSWTDYSDKQTAIGDTRHIHSQDGNVRRDYIELVYLDMGE